MTEILVHQEAGEQNSVTNFLPTSETWVWPTENRRSPWLSLPSG